MPEEPNVPTSDSLPDVIIKIDPDPVEPAATKDPVKDLSEQYKELEARSKADQEARDAALVRATEAENAAAVARREVQAAREAATSSNLDTITTALAGAQAALDTAKRDVLAAKQSGDAEAEVDAADRMNQARIDLRTYDEAKSNIEARKNAPRREAPSSPVDIVESYVANRSEPTAKWLREHKEYILDGRKNAKLTAGHHDAVAEGLTPDTAAYFEHVEKFIGIRKAEAPVTEGDDVRRPGAEQPKKQAQRAVAPVNGSAGSGGAVEKKIVTLRSFEAAAAVDGTHIWNYDDPTGKKRFKKGDPIGVEEFARRKRAMEASGQYDRTYDTQ